MLLRLTILLISFVLSFYSNAQTLEHVSSKTEFLSGTSIKINILDVDQLTTKDWLGLYSKGETRPRSYVSWKYLNGQASSTMAFSVPKEPGQYEFRLMSADYQELGQNRLEFNVKTLPEESISLTTDQTSYKPAATIQLSLNLPNKLAKKSWVGIFPADKPHNLAQGYLSYQYTDGEKSKQFIFSAPEKPGAYEFRFFDDSYGNELKSLPFLVAGFINTGLLIETDKADYSPQENMQVRFIANKDFPPKAWIGVFKLDDTQKAANKGYLTWQYLNKREQGALVFAAPAAKGDYELRMFSSSSGYVVATHRFTVNSSLNANYITKKIEDDGKISLYGIYFDFDKSTLKNESATTLTALANTLKQNPELNIEIQGHTDNSGDKQYNQRLSEERAKAVKQQLVKAFSISPQRMTAVGYGESQPVTSNTSESERALNRRVDVIKVH